MLRQILTVAFGVFYFLALVAASCYAFLYYSFK